MGEKYGVADSELMVNITECSSYGEAVRLASHSNHIVVYYAYEQWWF